MQNTVDKQSDEAKEGSIIVDSYIVILCDGGSPSPWVSERHSEVAPPHTYGLNLIPRASKR